VINITKLADKARDGVVVGIIVIKELTPVCARVAMLASLPIS
jgi:hypothetical protein